MKTIGKRHLFKWHHVPLGRMMRFGLIAFALLFGVNLNILASMEFGNYSYISHHPSLNEPWTVLNLCFYDTNGKDSFFTHGKGNGVNAGPALYIDGNYICSPDGELAWPGGDGTGNDGGLEDERGNNSWWRNSYSKTVDGKSYYIRFYDPRKDGGRFYVSVYIYMYDLEMGKSHTVSIKGDWKTNSYGTYSRTASWTINAIASPFEGPSEAKMTDINHFSISGKLKTNYGSTVVGTSVNADGQKYIVEKDLASKKTYASGTESYSNLSLETERNDYYNPEPKWIEYILKRSVSGVGDFRLYKWYKINVPGFVRPQDLQSEAEIWNRSITIKWNTNNSDAYCKEGTWKIFRKTAESNDWKLLTLTNLQYSQMQFTDEDKNLNYNTNYLYKVTFIPKNASSDATFDELTESTQAAMNRPQNKDFFFNVAATHNLNDRIKVTWDFVAMKNASVHPYTITLERCANYNSVNTELNVWEEVYKQTVNSASTTSGSYEDKDGLETMQSYYYRVKTSALEYEYVSEPTSGNMEGISYITEMTATRGTYSNMVKLKWSAKQIGTNLTYYDVQRRSLGSTENDEWITLATLSGTANTYSYDDATAQPGSYNQYRVTAWIMNKGQRLGDSYALADGFSIATGVISGRLTYGTGTAVEGARITLKQNNADGEMVSNLRSLRFSGAKSGLTYNTTAKGVQQLFKKDFSVQLYVSPSMNEMETNKTSYSLFDVDNIFGLNMTYDKKNKQYLLGVRVGTTQKTTTLAIPKGEWRNITCAYNSTTGTTTLYVVQSDTLAKVVALKGKKISVGDGNAEQKAQVNLAYLSDVSKPTFKGYADEFRFFTKELSEKEILRYYNHPLSGSENSLAIYWPMDEGIEGQKIAYDFSKTDNVGNGRHAEGQQPATSSTYVPSEDQLSLMAYTNEQGSYEVRGVPFSGEGTSYSIIPSLGIHKFSPTYLTRFVNMSMLNHSGVDFEDISSFPVSGQIYYEGTDYPVEGVNLYVDGTICTKNGEVITTDSEGKFTISVPIGEHYITINKSGHVFDNQGRYPSDPHNIGTRFTFDKEIKNLVFTDKTLVNFSGRVVGGNIEGDKPVGFGLSNNNIGVTEMVLTPLNEIPRMNVERVGETSYSYETKQENTAIESATENIKSTAWRGGGIDNCRKLFIHTDPNTGEFSALVPPLEYKISAIKVVKNGSEVGGSTTIDLSNPNIVLSDTLYSQDGQSYELYEYNSILKHIYHSTPSFTVKQEGRDDGSFGIDKYELTDEQGKLTIKDIYSVSKGKVTYNKNYGGVPLFIKGDPYTFVIKGFEKYVNPDIENSNENTSIVPLKGNIVTINNELSADQSVYVEDGTVNGKNVKAGQVVELESNELQLDDNGEAVYTWKAGLPNIAKPYTRNISIYYDIDGRTYDWEGNGMQGIILGDLPTGNNFVTSGPDKLLMVLRDPPGTNSSATWVKGKVTSKSDVKGSTFTENFSTKFQHKFGVNTETIIGTPGAGNIIVASSKDDLTTGVKIESSGESSTTKTYTTSITTEISTSSDPEYVGDQGDVFVGTATNIIFGKARNVGFKRNANSATLDLQDIVTTGLKLGTTFNYSRNYIENVLFPNWELMRKNMLTTMSASKIKSYVNNTNTVKYLTTLSPDDEHFGENGTYTAKAPKNPKNGVVYEDSVKWINTQMSNWINYLKMNEMAKVKAYQDRDKYLKKNYSFDSGSTLTYTIEKDSTSNHSWEWTCSAGVVLENSAGFTLAGVGFDCTIEDETLGGSHQADVKDTLTVTTFSYTLDEEGDDDAISVDVYDYDQYSPIFRTRGGQTCNPYEGKVVTKYYQPGTTIMEATMQIEVPRIAVDNPRINDIPTGYTANYTLQLSNASEIDEDVYYKLLIPDETNPKGANLMIDGKPITDNRIIKIPAGQTIEKALQLKQTDTSILDYDSIAVVLASQFQYDPTSTWDVIADTVYIYAHFVPSSSDITLSLSNTTINTQTGQNLTLTLKDFDRTYKNLKAFRIQYKKQGSTEWTQLKEFVLDEKNVTNNNELLPSSGASVNYMLNMSSFSDGNYVFRVESASTYGYDEVYKYSNEIALVKDCHRPSPLGTPEPSDGVLDIGEDLSVIFSENIQKGELTSEQNIRVTGVLNGATVEHETALSMQDSETTATTEANITLAGKDFSVDMWVNINGAGTILSHGVGSKKFTVGTNKKGNLVVNIAGTTYTSSKTVPTKQWAFLTLSYKTVDGSGNLSASVANDAQSVTLFSKKAVVGYDGEGPVSVGKNMNGAIHELLLWDEAHDLSTAILNRNISKSPSTRHLIGYWKMNEGEGTEIRDYARNRHMIMSDETWYINNENKAVSLDGKHFIAINAYDLNTYAGDDNAIELWMRGGKQAGEAQIVQMGDIALWTNNNGELQLTGKDAFKPIEQTESFATNSGNILDNAWHHIALNILRQGAAAVYVDGKRCLTTNVANIGSIATDKMTVGAKRTTVSAESGKYSYERPFKGQVDEVRVWGATLNADLLAKNRKLRLTGEEDGLLAYYPFEKKQLDDYNQIITTGSDVDLTNSSNTARYATLADKAANFSYTDEAPALRTKPTETNVNFTFVASDNKVVINLDEDPEVIEGCTLNFTIRDVRDDNGNYSEPAKWSAFINRKELVWHDDILTATQQVKDETTITTTIVNNGGKQQMWTLSGIPSWLIASAEYGTTNPRSETEVTFTVAPATPIGKYQETIYLKGNDNIEVPLTLNVNVNGQVPTWNVNPRDFENSMNVIGRVEIQGIPMTDTDDMVGAFIGEECRGVAHLEYKERYDGYFVTMDIYGNDEDKGKDVTFRIYDASSGTLYPSVEPNSQVKYETLSLVGKYATPVILNVLDKIEQSTDLKAGWNWISLNVKADDMKAESIFNMIADDVVSIKSQNSGWLMYEDGEWGGSLKSDLTNEQMYAVQMKSDRNLRVVGKSIKPSECQIGVKNGWNWISYYGRQVATVADAMAGLQPEDGDILKGQSGIAYFDEYEWAGSIDMLEPSAGYILNVNKPRTFGYPSVVVSNAQRRVMSNYTSDEKAVTMFTPVDFRTYSGNAIMAAQVVNGNKPVANAELGVFADGECRTAAVTDENGMAYLTIPGDETVTLTFKVFVNNIQSEVSKTLEYERDASYGSPKHPYVINLDDATDIIDVASDEKDVEIYDVQGRKINPETSRLKGGVYIVNGKKVLVK